MRTSSTLKSKRLTLIFASATLIAIGSPALADSIDGDWCDQASHVGVDGPKGISMGGNPVEGRYDRHHFAYTVPANEPGAGAIIDMRLMNEETVVLIRVPAGGAAAPAEMWRRCKPVS